MIPIGQRVLGSLVRSITSACIKYRDLKQDKNNNCRKYLIILFWSSRVVIEHRPRFEGIAKWYSGHYWLEYLVMQYQHPFLYEIFLDRSIESHMLYYYPDNLITWYTHWGQSHNECCESCWYSSPSHTVACHSELYLSSRYVLVA